MRHNDRLTTLIIGYGNTLRGDDGIGVRVAQIVAQWNFPGARSRAFHQLTPELALELAQVDRAIFVDAYPASPTQQEVQILQLEPNPAAEIRSHCSEPASLLALSQLLFDRSPLAWFVAIPGENFELQDSLSDRAQQNIDTALRQIEQLLAGTSSH